MNENPGALLPELLLVLAAVIGLLAGSWLPRHRQWVVRLIAVVACAAGVVAAIADLTRPVQLVFGDTYVVDVGLGAVRIIVLASIILTIGLSIDRFAGSPRETEFYVLLLLGGLGAIVMAGAKDLLLLVAAYLLASIPLYALTGIARTASGTEAAMKYYLMGALSGVTMLVGATLLFGVGGSTQYSDLAFALSEAPRAVVAVGLVAVLAGLLFKIGAVPLHFWVPDVVQGATTPVAAFVATIPKIGGLWALYRLLSTALSTSDVDWSLLIAVIAAATMTLGNLAAFFQDDVRRLLAYSTISQVGYLLMAVAAANRAVLALPALGFYLAAYAVTNLGAFAVVAELPRATTLADYRGMATRHRWLALSLVICLLGLIGTPPTAVFVGKLTVFTAIVDAGMAWLAVIAVVNTMASVFYYLRWIAPAVRGRDKASSVDVLSKAGTWGAASAHSAAAASLLLGVLSGPVLALLG
ncbi:NADH-quinone oxidoreductase subunit N [Pseudonocardia sp. KRD-182]|uniref:NADH-quinone oxidoreductase subunit N n=1 Tax=Pseudonocardia oceani TaxID=2792013 RepID=UPI001C49D76E|nr:NADH-quinone oxidoreductase subunit N [Pseudonocardia oceani]MBW0109981.1 NADH-quinone oxidoreductase subunit N [Pseudonocardia oceani]